VNLKRWPQFGFDKIQQYYLIHQGDKHHCNTAEVNNNRETYSSAKHATEQTDARPETQLLFGSSEVMVAMVLGKMGRCAS